MEKSKSHKTKKWVALAAVIAAAGILMASTYLWFSARESVDNVFKMDAFDVRITEKFDPNEPVVPGAEIKKEVGVENKSDVPVAVRMQLKEALQLLKLDTKGNPNIVYKATQDLAAGEIMVTASQNQIDSLLGSGYKAVTVSGNPAGVKVLERITKKADGTGDLKEYFAYVEASLRVVEYNPTAGSFGYGLYEKGDLLEGLHGHATQHFEHNDIVIGMESAKWVLDKSTGWYYYDELLAKDSISGNIVKSVTFKENMDNKYKGAVYTLTPVMEAVQGKQEAVDQEWKSGSVFKIDDQGKVTITVP